MMIDYIRFCGFRTGEEILSAIAEDWWKKVITQALYLLHGMLGQ